MISIREGTKADVPAAVVFLSRMHNPAKKSWFELLANGRHPSTDISNFIIAKDTEKIVALAIYQPWSYSYCGHILKGVRIEEAFCEHEYRNQGIVNDIFSKIADLAAGKGGLFELAYGQDALYGLYSHLGYTYGVPDEEDGFVYLIQDESTSGAFRIEEASNNDIPFMAKLYQKNLGRNLLAQAIGCKEIDYMKNAYAGTGMYECKFYLVKSSKGEACGFFLSQTSGKRIYMMELDDTCSYFQVRPYMSAFYRQHGLDRIALKLGAAHPIYTVFKGCLHLREYSELGYVKVYDLSKFLMCIADILNERLANSPYAFFSGTFTMAMHNADEVLQFAFADGKLTDVSPASKHTGEVNIERDRFIKLLFGRVSPQEMEEEKWLYYFDNDDYRNIFAILFPKIQSHVVSLN